MVIHKTTMDMARMGSGINRNLGRGIFKNTPSQIYQKSQKYHRIWDYSDLEEGEPFDGREWYVQKML